MSRQMSKSTGLGIVVVMSGMAHLSGCVETHAVTPTNAKETDFCGAQANCGVQYRAVGLLDPESSRVLVNNPYEFVGSAFDPGNRHGIYNTRTDCGPLNKDWVDPPQKTTGTIITNDHNHVLIQTNVTASLNKVVNASVTANLDKAVKKAIGSELQFERSIYTLNLGHSPDRRAECRKILCVPVGETCAKSNYAVIESAAIVSLSGQTKRTIVEQLKAEVKADATLNLAVVDAAAKAGTSLDNLLDHAVSESTDAYQFAAYLGWKEKLQ